MPFTIAHPCAVLPFAKFCPRYLNFAALVCGSISPDLTYAFQQYQFSAQAHTFGGSFLFDLPTGLLLLLAYYWCKDLIASQLPSPHREFWQSMPVGRLSGISRLSIAESLSALTVFASSVLLGSWTHIVWDGFTHQRGFAVELIPLLSSEIVSIGSIHLQLYKLLQYVCSAAGLVVLFRFYLTKLSMQPLVTNNLKSKSKRKFYLLVAFSVLAAATVTLLQTGLGSSPSAAHIGFVFVVNCMFMLPVVFFLAGLAAKYSIPVSTTPPEAP